MSEAALLPDLFKTEYRKIISVLCKSFGLDHIEIAEDITHDTFLLASETWGLKGMPENPTAWLYTVAKNKTKDYLRRNSVFTDKILPSLSLVGKQIDEYNLDLSEKNITDSQLQMIFAICHPSISKSSQIGLALRILCGFGIEEIAEAFISNKETINKRLHRAKEKLRTHQIVIEFPEASQINDRLDAVLTTIYLLFNEGYYSSTKNSILRKDLCIEAMRLNQILLENSSTNTPKTNALMSLMCFHASRFEARINENGDSILYDNQDKNLWNAELIQKGNYFLIESAKGDVITKYHLEASIAYWHCTKDENNQKWEHILQLYNQLLQIEYSPIAALNRTYVLSKTKGNEIAISEAIKLNLSDNHLYESLLGYLYREIDVKKAKLHFEKAFELAKTEADRNVIKSYLATLN